MKKATVLVLVIVLVIILGAAAALLLLTRYKSGQNGSPRPSSQPYVSDVSIKGFAYTDEGLFMKLKIYGEADLREFMTINGVYGYWYGLVHVRLPDGRQAQVLKPENHTEFFTRFNMLQGELAVDVYLPTQWYENPRLEGIYNVTVFLKGPYSNVSVLFHRDFNLKMDFEATVTPSVWSSWEQKISIKVTNTGDVPVILQGVGMEMTGTGTVIGWVYALTLEERILVVMPGETKNWVGTPTMAGDFMEELAGKTTSVDFVFDVAGAPRRFAVTLRVSFPA